MLLCTSSLPFLGKVALQWAMRWAPLPALVPTHRLQRSVSELEFKKRHDSTLPAQTILPQVSKKKCSSKGSTVLIEKTNQQCKEGMAVQQKAVMH